MNFATKEFIFLLCSTFPLWWVVRKNYKTSLLVLFISSAIFYGLYKPALLFLLGMYCIWGWGTGLAIGRNLDKNLKRPAFLWLLLGVTGNLLGLCFFKYTPLVVNTLVGVAGELEWSFPLETIRGWSIPVGISFFSFTSITYLADVYRRQTQAEPNPFRFALYLSFFPKLVAGPILRPSEFLNQLQPGRLPKRVESPMEALHLVARGLFKKVVLANRIGSLINPFFLYIADPSTEGIWALPYLYLYSLQIYLDFSAYTDIARGVGLMFGFRWPQNFNLPYLASSVREFWQRWHITLSLFLRDYLYIPLGGNRGSLIRTSLNLLTTMLLGGLWHGTSWSFAVWGGVHGILLIINRFWSRTRLRNFLANTKGWGGRVPPGRMIILTFHCVTLTWTFFRLKEFQHAVICLKKCLWFDPHRLLAGVNEHVAIWLALALYALIAFLISGWLKTVSNNDQPPAGPASSFHWGFALGLGISLLILSYLLSLRTTPPFIYFRF